MKNPEFDRLRDTWEVNDAIRRTMRSNRRSGTRPEQVLKAALAEGGFADFENNVSDLPGSPDIVFRDVRLAVLVHGCYWHGCPLCGRQRIPRTNTLYWEQKFAKNRERDDRVERELKERDFHVMKIWECELKKDIGSVFESVRSVHEYLKALNRQV